ncbi:hypothetical protein HYPSUDRAFT_205416 [Hypholoma sublateritium FD-334 SS-4]|uniref:Uncharacterized protein n=1 Tax=Hypholoma sublateritium (strain FD-334 SS-4) TaxID=945553 RepID=A0A0D2NNT3_HYPSF|nr:hypothetical protein HYPSUDRAFT_205416 [Hypholoma sublateritium FD-334 SS-4]
MPGPCCGRRRPAYSRRSVESSKASTPPGSRASSSSGRSPEFIFTHPGRAHAMRARSALALSTVFTSRFGPAAGWTRGAQREAVTACPRAGFRAPPPLSPWASTRSMTGTPRTAHFVPPAPNLHPARFRAVRGR